MIPILRKTRKKLADDNKPLKYVRYAIGEIVLVVVGILIALQINNFNNQQQQRKIEQAYLVSLQTEFKTNLKKINDCILENTERVQAVEQMLTLFDPKVRDTFSTAVLSDYMYVVFRGDATYMPSNGVLTDIISSGNLNVILNAQLRQDLASFESTLDYIKVQETATNVVKYDMQTLLDNHGTVRKIMVHKGLGFEHKSISDSLNNKQLFGLIAFENNLLDYYMTIRAANGERFFGGLKAQIEQILVEIKTEIK